MTIEIIEENGSTKALLNGRLDTAAAADIATQFNQLYEKADHEIVLDFTNL